MVRRVLSQNTVPLLIEIALVDDDPISCRAGGILEFMAKEDISFLLPYIDIFTEGWGSLHLDSPVRPIAKICEFLSRFYFSATKNKVQDVLKENHLERITNACVDWLIGDQKVAAQAHSMISLLLLGQKYKWIHPNLKCYLNKIMPKEARPTRPRRG